MTTKPAHTCKADADLATCPACQANLEALGRPPARKRPTRTRGRNVGTGFAPAGPEAVLRRFSKAVLIDVVWNLCLLGTDETEGEMAVRMARELVLVLEGTGRRVPVDVRALAAQRIDSDPPAPEPLDAEA
jgi:hypothetical protein